MTHIFPHIDTRTHTHNFKGTSETWHKHTLTKKKVNSKLGNTKMHADTHNQTQIHTHTHTHTKAHYCR